MSHKQAKAARQQTRTSQTTRTTGTTTDAEGGEGPIDLTKLTVPEVQKTYARLAAKGKTICGQCKQIYALRDCVALAFQGNIMLAVCPSCMPKAAIAAHKEERGIAVGLVDPQVLKQAGRPQIVQAPANVRLPSLSSVLGPNVDRRRY